VVTTLAGTAGTVGSANGTGAAASFDDPTGVAVDPATGNVYVADKGNDTIRMITSAGVVTTLAGTAGTVGSANGTGAAASFDGPQGVAVDAAGNVYVADTGNDTIRMITPGGVVTTLAGTAGTVGSANGTGAAASFNGPRGVAFDPTTDTLFAADTGNDTIRSLSPPTVTGHAGLTGTTAQSVSAALTGLLPATTYYFQAVATSSAGTADGGIMSFTTSAAIAPAATTQAATSVAGTAATLNGTVNPEGFATTADFVYGTDPTLTTGTTTIPIPALTIGSGTSAVAVTEPLSGLLPSTTYYFQLEATNSAGTTDGGILSFTTTTSTVTTPVLTVGQATNVTTTGATVNGTVNPNGVATSVYFVYGTQPTLTSGTSTTAQQSIGSGTTAVPVTATLTGLTPGTTYYFEPAALSNGVTTLGPIQSFTTTSTGLSVTNLQRYGYHDQPTEFVLTFNEALNPTSAQDVNNYQIVPMVNGQPGSPIALSSAVYDSTNDTVTLMPVNLVYLYGQYQLTVTGTSPSGVSSSTGQFLSGAGPGQPGTNYVQSFGESILAGPNLDPPMSKATRARILRTWNHEEAMAARIAARIDKAAEQRAAARTDKAAERRTAAASRADRAPAATTSPTIVVAAPVVATPVPSAVDAVLGNIFAPEDQQGGAEQS
jgi:DNA-binding beta-propeller fold protein YncE